MIEKLSPQACTAMELAREEARRFQHEYVGTEHLLLGLIAEGSGVAATVLRSRGLDYAVLRREIEQLVQLGPAPITEKELPLTPRGQQAVQFAIEDARVVGQPSVDTEHLLTGLLREPDGVAGIILRKCGLNIEEISAEVSKIRLLQMKIVERVVRPVQANIARKRRMRDELLTHLSAIFDEELARSGDPTKAVEAAAVRFGSPTELTEELQATVPRREQWEAAIERLSGWRAPESVERWMFRSAVQISSIMFFAFLLAAILLLGQFGWNYSVWLALRPLAAMVIVLPISAAVSGISYFKMRDHIYGVFGSRKSWGQTVGWAGLLAVVTVGCGFTFLLVSYGSLSPADAAFYPIVVVGIIWAAGALVTAKNMGPQQIRDTTWALLDLDDQPLAA